MSAFTVQQAFALALQHHQAGRLAEAEAIYRQILVVQPRHADALHLLGAMAHQLGGHDLAIDLIEQAIALDPENPGALSNLAAAYLAQGRWVEAMTRSGRAVELDPTFADARYNLGAALAELGRPEEALTSYRRALEIKPDHALAENNLGNVLRQLHRLDDAIAAYRRALQWQPGNADAHNNLGVALAEKGQVDEAIACYRGALEIKPNAAAIHHNLGNALQRAGQFEPAAVAYRRALQLEPDRAETYRSLGNALLNQGRLDEAIVAFRGAIRWNPDDLEAWTSLGNALQRCGNIDEAVASFSRAHQLKPDDPHNCYRLGSVLQRQRRLDEAAAVYARAIELQPNHTGAQYGLAEIFKDQGRWDEALAAMRRVLVLAPDVPRVHSDLILMLQISPGLDEAAIAAECRRWNDRFAVPMKQFVLPHPNDRNPERRLRIGYVSPDFRDHVVGRNLRPLFREHDRAQSEIICYSGVTRPDNTTDEFRGWADRWRNIANMSDESLATTIRQDEVDILVDLTLHAAGNRLAMFARQPAPVQVSFAGYPGSTGLDAIAYRLSDRYLESKIEDHRAAAKEQICFIDSFWCYDPCGVKLEVSELPAKENGFVTFGSLNDLSKSNDLVLKLWARVLGGVKDSRLMLLTYRGNHRQRLVDRLRREGVEAARIEFCEPRPRPDYLALYHRADIMLDPFPYNGHTTSLDALWMGVPVVSLAGERAVSRAGLSQLTNLGLPELVAFTEDDYMSIATQLAHDLPRLAELRATLRPRMEASVLMDAPRFARQIEAAYRTMWREWCAKQTTQ